MKTVLNPTIAAHIDIKPISFGEEFEIYFKASQNWIGSFSVKVFNSNVKNNEIDHQCNLTFVNDLMTFLIKGLQKGNHYYEIWSDTQKRIIFKGDLNVI